MVKRIRLSKPLATAAASIALAAGPSHAQDAVPEVPLPPTPLPLDWCLERAAAANPSIAAQAAARDAARERIDPAGSLDDPRISYQATNLPTGSFDFRSTPMSGHLFGLKQRLPFPGLLGSREDAARFAAQAAGSDLDDRVRRIRAAAEQHWASLGFAQRALEITDRNIELLRQLTRIAETRYQVGSGLQQDVLRAQVALTQLLQDRLRRESSLAAAGSSLAALLDLPADTPFPETDDLAMQEPLPELAPLLAALERSSPLLEAARARVEEAVRRVRATELEGRPDFDLGLGYRLRASVPGDPVRGDDFLSAGVTLRLPVDRGKWRSRIAEMHALERHARALYRRQHADLQAALRSAHADLVRADREARLLDTGLVPQARQSLESSRSGYEVGRVDFLSLLDSQVRLLDSELRRARAYADRHGAFAALEALLGKEIR